MSNDDLWERAAQDCIAAVTALTDAGVRTEALAELIPERRSFTVFTRAARMQAIGDVWRMGSLLLGTDGRLFALGRATRAAERGRIGYQSLSREARRDIAAAALRGGYAAGTTVNFDARELQLSEAGVAAFLGESPLGIADGEVRVRWKAGAPLEGAQTLERYLAEWTDLLIHPPFARDEPSRDRDNEPRGDS